MAKTLITDRKRVLLLAFTMAIVSISVAWVAILILYESAVDQQRKRLIETAQSHARMIEAIERYSVKKYGDRLPGESFAETLIQIKDAHNRFQGFGDTGEFTLAKRVDDRIEFLLSHRHSGLTVTGAVSYY